MGNCIKIAFAIDLDNHQCKYLLKKAGYTLSSSEDINLIIRYCIENNLGTEKLYDYLTEYGYDTSILD